ncbi:hypothetical protein QUF64_01895 [Anaerolineales bacterium HSG6]|nr:hypothetical protein [Anaerolineales bacterium HSG6]MDM8531035.1 hypothetical protein [Anaerolineales bacterium HSG25]
MPIKQTNQKWVVRPQVPDSVFTDRQEYLDYLYKAALNINMRRTISTVLLGQRRMGKTEIFIRVINRLFWEQDYRDPEAIIPIFYTFPDQLAPHDSFPVKYVENFIRWYGAFRLREPQVLSDRHIPQNDLKAYLTSKAEFPKHFLSSFNLLDLLLKNGVSSPYESAVMLPREIGDWDDSNIIMFLDEFQNSKLPQHNFNVVGWMQRAVESNTCPHFVTGSAMTILSREILGRGALFGRFRSLPIKPLVSYWGAELALRSATYYGAKISDDMAPIIAERCGGNPYYITAVIQQAEYQNEPLYDQDTLNNMLAVDLSSGFIWAELNDQVSKWIERINEYGITKWVLYLSALEEEERIDLARIKRELWERDRQDVPLEKIRDVLIQLSRGDLVEFLELGNWFRKVNDPILIEFLKVWGRIDVEGKNADGVRDTLIRRYQRLERQIKEHLGYLAEVYMAQVLLSSQRKTLPGRFFHYDDEVPIPDFIYLHLRERLGVGPEREIDILGAAGIIKWVGESKYLHGRKVGREAIEIVLRKAAFVKEELEADVVWVWYFANDGFTDEALELMTAEGVLWSVREDLNGLLDHVGLRRLPEFVQQET